MDKENNLNQNNQLLYTTTDGATIYPSIEEWEMKEKIVSNTYQNGVGRMVFKEELYSIPESFFMACANLKTIEIPPSCKVIHNHAFYSCINLEQVTFNEGLRAIQDYAFCKTYLKKIEVPASCFIISNYAFAETPLKEVRLKTPTAAYRYIGDFVFDVNCRIEGISKYDDFSITSVGFSDDKIK